MIATEYTSSPVAQPATQIRTEGYVRSLGMTSSLKAPQDVALAEHAGDVDPDPAEESLHARRVVEQPLLVGGDGRHPLARHPRCDAAPQRGRRIFAEVVPVPQADAFEEELDLDLLDLRARGCLRAGLP